MNNSYISVDNVLPSDSDSLKSLCPRGGDSKGLRPIKFSC